MVGIKHLLLWPIVVKSAYVGSSVTLKMLTVN